MNSETQLTTPEPSVALMLQGALANIQSGAITPEHVDVLGKMMDLYERNEARQAKKDFAVALAEMQAETGTIQAMSIVANRDGSERYRFAKFETIMEKAKPMMAKHGFSHSFDTIAGDGKLTAIFKLTHKGGHSESNQFTVRTSKGQGTNDAQDDMGTKSYAKRGAVCDGLGIVISHDADGADDASNLGAPITQEQADTLRELCDETKSDRKKFLDYAGAATFEEIASSRYEDLTAVLMRKRK